MAMAPSRSRLPTTSSRLAMGRKVRSTSLSNQTTSSWSDETRLELPGVRAGGMRPARQHPVVHASPEPAGADSAGAVGWVAGDGRGHRGMSSPIETTSALEPDVVLDVWRRRKWIGIAAFVIVLAGAITAAVSLPNLYRATTTVLVERPQVSEAFVRQSVTADLEMRIQTIHRQVMSRERLSEVIQRLGLYRDLWGVEPMNELVERLRREAQLGLQAVEQSTGRTETIAFTLSYSGRDPETVATLVNTLAAFYVE